RSCSMSLSSRCGQVARLPRRRDVGAEDRPRSESAPKSCASARSSRDVRVRTATARRFELIGRLGRNSFYLSSRHRLRFPRRTGSDCRSTPSPDPYTPPKRREFEEATPCDPEGLCPAVLRKSCPTRRGSCQTSRKGCEGITTTRSPQSQERTPCERD